VSDGCEGTRLRGIQNALSSIDDLVEELEDCATFGNWLEEQLVQCDEDIETF
jgi:hypothetical protein